MLLLLVPARRPQEALGSSFLMPGMYCYRCGDLTMERCEWCGDITYVKCLKETPDGDEFFCPPCLANNR